MLTADDFADVALDHSAASAGGVAPSYPTYPQQTTFIQAKAHNAAFVAGIGSGKTIAGAVRAWRAAYGYIGDEKLLETPNLGIVTAPTYPMLRDATLRAFLETLGDAVVKHNSSQGIVTLANGSEVLFRSTEHPERLRGPSISWWWGDEAALYEARVWNIMIGRLRQFGKLGYAWITSTPKGRNWLYKTFIQDNFDKPDYFVQKAKSSDNPFLDTAIVQSWEQAYVGDFARQELDAEFIAYEGLIYPEFSRELHVTYENNPTFSYYVAGVDWGYANPGVLLIFGVDGDGRMHLVHEEYERQMHVEEWALVAAQLQKQYQCVAWYCDPSEPDFIAAFQNRSVPAQEAYNEVLSGIHSVKARMAKQGDNRPRLAISSEAVHTAIEFESYMWMEHSKDGLRDKPRKANDHAMDAMRYAVMGVEQMSGAGEFEMNYFDTSPLRGAY